MVLLSNDSTPNFTIWNDIDSEDLMNAIHTCHTAAANQWANFIAIDYGEVHIKIHNKDTKETSVTIISVE